MEFGRRAVDRSAAPGGHGGRFCCPGQSGGAGLCGSRWRDEDPGRVARAERDRCNRKQHRDSRRRQRPDRRRTGDVRRRGGDGGPDVREPWSPGGASYTGHAGRDRRCSRPPWRFRRGTGRLRQGCPAVARSWRPGPDGDHRERAGDWRRDGHLYPPGDRRLFRRGCNAQYGRSGGLS